MPLRATVRIALLIVVLGLMAMPGTVAEIQRELDRENVAPHFMPLDPEIVDQYNKSGTKIPIHMTEQLFAGREGSTVNRMQPRAGLKRFDAGEGASSQEVRAIVLLVECLDNPPGGPTVRFSPGVWDSMLFGDIYIRGGADTTTTHTLKNYCVPGACVDSAQPRRPIAIRRASSPRTPSMVIRARSGTRPGRRVRCRCRITW